MLIAGLVTLGLVSLGRLNTDLNPDVDFPFATVTTVLAILLVLTTSSSICNPVSAREADGSTPGDEVRALVDPLLDTIDR